MFFIREFDCLGITGIRIIQVCVVCRSRVMLLLSLDIISACDDEFSELTLTVSTSFKHCSLFSAYMQCSHQVIYSSMV